MQTRDATRAPKPRLTGRSHAEPGHCHVLWHALLAHPLNKPEPKTDTCRCSARCPAYLFLLWVAQTSTSNIFVRSRLLNPANPGAGRAGGEKYPQRHPTLHAGIGRTWQDQHMRSAAWCKKRMPEDVQWPRLNGGSGRGGALREPRLDGVSVEPAARRRLWWRYLQEISRWGKMRSWSRWWSSGERGWRKGSG